MRNEIISCIEYAAFKHSGQRKRGCPSVPYINHLISVARMLDECMECSSTLLKAAVFHDILEDTDVTADELSLRFGERTTGIVLELTDDMTQEYRVRKQKQLESAEKLSPEAKLIRLADKTCNIRDIRTLPLVWTREEKLDYMEWSEKLFPHLAGHCKTLDKKFLEEVILCKSMLSGNN